MVAMQEELEVYKSLIKTSPLKTSKSILTSPSISLKDQSKETEWPFELPNEH